MSFTGRPAEFDATAITNDAFFPAFNLGDFNAQARIDTTINPALVQQVVETAIAQTNLELAVEKTAWQDDGFATLAAVPVAGAVSLYLRAVFCRAKAVLVKEYPTLTRKKDAENTARESDETEGFYIQAAEKALRTLCGISASPVCKLL